MPGNALRVCLYNRASFLSIYRAAASHRPARGHHLRASFAAGQNDQGADRVRQGASQGNQFCERRHWQRGAPRHRALALHDQHQDEPHPVQRHLAGIDRYHSRADQPDIRHHLDDVAERLRAIAVTTAQRVATEPNIPTVAESGVPGYEATSWFALFAPARTPAAIANKLNSEVTALLKLPDVKERMLSLGADAMPMSPRELSGYVETEIVKWGKLIKATNAKAD